MDAAAPVAAAAAAAEEEAVSQLQQQQQDSLNGKVLAASKFSQQLIEQKEKELHQCIASNYSRIRDVERELRELQMQVRLTAEPKKAALELLRKKIEEENIHLAAVRLRHDAAKKAYEAARSELKSAEATKQQLCDELSNLVSTSVTTQLESFEQLKRKLDELQQHGGGAAAGPAAGPAAGAAAAATPAAAPDSSDGGDAMATQQQPQQVQHAAGGAEHGQQQQQPQLPVSTTTAAAQAAAAKAAAEAEAAAARARHVQLPGRSSRHAGNTAAVADGTSSSGKQRSSGSGSGGGGGAAAHSSGAWQRTAMGGSQALSDAGLFEAGPLLPVP